MPKLLWVALPLLLAAALLALQMLRRRPPSRHVLNVWSSLLLMAYVLTTASLGIFWVANQQLPVFDWHYLFGYGTVLLVSLHLVLNFPIVWRFLTRRATASAPVHADVAPGRRSALAALSVLLATGVAFALGMRHGRSELRIMPAAGRDGAAPADPGALALPVVERFHAFSSHSRTGVLLRAPGVDWGDAPEAFKRYPGAPRVMLPAPRSAPGAAFDLASLGAVLWHTSGVTDTRGGLNLRASPSSGALFSTELYVVSRTVAGLAPGLWHYDSQAHALERVHALLPDDAALGAAAEPALHNAAAAVIATAIFRRTGQKYRDRTYRYVLADLGHALENLRVAAGAAGGQARFVAGFDEARAAATLRIDEGEEGVLALVALQAAPQDGVAASRPRQPTAHWRTPAWPGDGAAPLGVTAAVHAATSLRAAAPALPAMMPTQAAALPPNAIVLPSAAATAARWLDIIAVRRSVRRFAQTPLPLDALAGVLVAMTTRTEPILSSAVRVNLVIHAVAGIPPGSYRYEPARRALLPRRAPAELSAAARAAALDQDVIGDAAAVFVLSIDKAVFAADPLGPARGYRHAFLEAGLVGERVYLEAGARGLGVCAVGAFYDDEAAALVGIDPAREWVVHFTALGIPAG
jgi:SagB-type dehydrogenase family enzyme